MVDLPHISCRIQKALKAADIALSHPQVQELVAAGLGYNTLVAYQYSPEENPGLDKADYVLLDIDAMKRHAADLGITNFPAQDFIRVFSEAARPVRAFASFSDFVDDIFICVEMKIVLGSDEVSAAMSIANAWLGHMDIKFEPTTELTEAECFWNIAVSAVIQGEHDPNRVCGGSQVNVSATVRLAKVGRRCFAGLEILDVGAAVVTR